jgi:starch synthase
VNILIVSSEYHTLAKAGGLADAVTALAQGLAAQGHSVDVILPRYKNIDTEGFDRDERPLQVQLGTGIFGCAVHTGTIKGVRIHLIEHDALYRRDGIYGPAPDQSFQDNLLRFALLSRGALEVALLKGLKPQIIHVHDWSSALVPVYLRYSYADTSLSTASTVLSIHNLAFQGVVPTAEGLSVPGLSRDIVEKAGLFHGDTINLLKGGILTVDRIVAVSPTYAKEIQQPRYGYDLHTALQIRAPHLVGILNGIDTTVWNPDTDPYIPARYNREDMRGKRICKSSLQNDLDLTEDPDIPVVGMVTRLTRQKGIDELFDPDYGVAERLLQELPLQWIVLGTGERWCEDRIRELSRQYDNFAGLTMYSDTLAHQIEAGSDFFLMPSRYEPCGLNQMYSMRYGTIPVVTRTGGLVDSVDSSSGFHIEAHTPDAIFAAVSHAVERYYSEGTEILQMQQNAMSRDFGLEHSVAQYMKLYDELLAAPV